MQLVDGFERGLHGSLFRSVRHEDYLGAAGVVVGLFLDSGCDADVEVAEHLEYLREDAGALHYIHAHVVFRLQLTDGAYMHVGGE